MLIDQYYILYHDNVYIIKFWRSSHYYRSIFLSHTKHNDRDPSRASNFSRSFSEANDFSIATDWSIKINKL